MLAMRGKVLDISGPFAPLNSVILHTRFVIVTDLLAFAAAVAAPVPTP